MFEYYTALFIVTICIILSALTVIYYDDILEKFNKNIFFTTYIVLLISCTFEWIVMYLSKTNSPRHFITTFSTALVFFAAPSMIVVLAWGIDDTKSNSLSHTVLVCVALNFLVSFSAFFSNLIFYYDSQNIYHRGSLYFIHFILVIISVLILLMNTFRLGLKYQSKNNYILILDFIIFLVGLLTHFIFRGVWILWISVSIAITLVYIYYSSLVNQIDVLTGILNRKCYDGQLYDLNNNAIIIIIDVNKFKEINDTLGHNVGDYCLVEIAHAIKKVYRKSGYCYRIGGDEFSVILYKNLDSIDKLNAKFSKILSEKKYKHELPTVSIGHSYYYPNKSSIQKVIEEADSMMYTIKQQNPLSTIVSK